MKNPVKSKKWRYLTLLGLLFLVFHFTMILVYVYNSKGVTNTFLHYNQKYMVPAFHQQWPLFAPDPGNYNCQLLARYSVNNKWSEWLTTDKLKEEHYKINHMEASLTSDLNNLIYSKEGIYYVDGNPQFDRLERSFFYIETYFYINQYFKKYYSVDPDSIQVRLDYAFTADFFTGEVQDSVRLDLNPISTNGK